MKPSARAAAARFALLLSALSLAALSLSCAAKRPASSLGALDYASWARTTETPLDFPIPGHESRHRRIFINAAGAEHRRSGGRSDYPDGTIVVKEIFGGLDAPAPGEKPVALDIMVKDRSAPDARGGWRWIVRDAAAGTDSVFSGDFCAVCHAEASKPHPYGDRNRNSEERDYLFY